MDSKKSDLLKETIKFVENIEFSDNVDPKTEIKQEVWKSSSVDVKPKLEQVELNYETGQAKIKNDLLKETIDFVTNIEFSDNIMPPKKEIKGEV